MKLFHKIEGAVAIVRVGVIHKQLDLYHRGDVVYIPHSGGYLRTVQRFGEHIGTAKPDIHVIDWEAIHGDVKEVNKVLTYKALN